MSEYFKNKNYKYNLMYNLLGNIMADLLKVKKWGHSLGIVIPAKVVKNEKIHENEIIEVKIKKVENPLKETYGTYKFNKSTQEIKDELRSGWYE